MNKKLFALLASAALMAGSVPSVFADGLDFKLKLTTDKTQVKPGTEVTYDVTAISDGKTDIQSVQFAWVVDNGTLTDTRLPNKKYEAEGSAFNFVPKFNYDADDIPAWSDYAYLGKLDEGDTTDNKDYQVVFFDTSAVGMPISELKIGTLTVTAGDKTGEKINISTDTNLVIYNTEEHANWDAEIAEVMVVTDVNDSTPPTTSTPDSTPAGTNSNNSNDSNDSNDSNSSKKDNNSSKTNGANNNTNTGAASTVAVALAASAAALVVISKKRK